MPLTEEQLLNEINRITAKLKSYEYALLYVQALFFHEAGEHFPALRSVVDTALGGRFEDIAEIQERERDGLSTEDLPGKDH